jgi:hypothetical protein
MKKLFITFIFLISVISVKSQYFNKNKAVKKALKIVVKDLKTLRRDQTTFSTTSVEILNGSFTGNSGTSLNQTFIRKRLLKNIQFLKDYFPETNNGFYRKTKRMHNVLTKTNRRKVFGWKV